MRVSGQATWELSVTCGLMLALLVGLLMPTASAQEAGDPDISDVIIANLVCPTDGGARTEFVPAVDLIDRIGTGAYVGCQLGTGNTFSLSDPATGGIDAPLQTVVTDATGHLTFADVPVGSYTLVEEATTRLYDFRQLEPGYVISVVTYDPSLAAAPTVPATAAGSETITIYGALCPTDYAGDNYFNACYQTPAAGARYKLNPIQLVQGRIPPLGYAVAGADGVYAFTELAGVAPGRVELQVVRPEGLRDVRGVRVPAAGCTASDGRDVPLIRQDTRQVGSVFSFEIEAGDDLRCDVYFLPISNESAPPTVTQDTTPTIPDTTPAPAVTVTPTATATPEPGRAAVISGGRCLISTDDLDAVAELAGLTAPEGEAVGQEVETIPETSFTMVALSLDALLADDHAIVIRADDGDELDPVACGDLGGILNENGSLTIGLYEVDGSDLAGIAFLTSNADSPDQTDVSLFLVEGLAAAEEGTPPAS